MAWTTSDTRYKSTSFTAIQETSPPDDLMHDDSIPDEHVHLSDDEDSVNDHLPKDNVRKDWWKPFLEEEIPAIPEPAWTIPSSNVSDVKNNWASALVSTYETPAENSLLVKTGDMTTFINWYCRKMNKTMLTQADFKGQAYEVVKAFYPDVVQHSQNRRDLPRDNPLVSVEVLRYDIKRSKSENKGIVPTEMELVLEQTQQGTSHEVGELTEDEITDKFPDEHLMILKAKLNDEEPWSVGYNLKDWSEKLNDALWAFRTIYKTPTGYTPFRMVYGKACHLPVEIEHKAYWALKQCNMDLTAAAKNRFMELNELMELRDGAYENTRIYKERTKRWHDSRLRGDKNFINGDNVLLFNSRLKLHMGKLKSKWSRPFVVKTMNPYGAVEIIDKNGLSFKVNGQRYRQRFEASKVLDYLSRTVASYTNVVEDILKDIDNDDDYHEVGSMMDLVLGREAYVGSSRTVKESLFIDNTQFGSQIGSDDLG
ncbi:reverse transcriptase domain-containing protein [Tanacetum coccineum]